MFRASPYRGDTAGVTKPVLLLAKAALGQPDGTEREGTLHAACASAATPKFESCPALVASSHNQNAEDLPSPAQAQSHYALH